VVSQTQENGFAHNGVIYRCHLDRPTGYVMAKLPMLDIAANCRVIRERIAEAAIRAHRNAAEIKILAAAKSQPADRIRAAAKAGIRLIGENYVQEAQEKKRVIDDALEWHMIGHLQRNKVRSAIELFDVVESLDSLELARELDKHGSRHGRIVRAFVEVNLAGEESKFGSKKDEVLALLIAIAQLSHLRVEGLMTVPPFTQNPEDVRPLFRQLRELQVTLSAQRLPNVDLKELSMGMTHDYGVAVEEGATIVRIGTALFGPREP
jgi:PLP dependent protein